MPRSEAGIRSRIDFGYGFLLVDAQSFCQPSELLVCKFLELILIAGLLKPASFKSLVQEQKTIPFPKQSLNAVSTPAAKKEEGILIRIQIKR